MKRSLALCAAMLTAGCYFQPTGFSALYQPVNPHPVAIAIDPDAPSVGQQFRREDHQGIDVYGPVGMPVLAAAEGEAVRVWTDPLYGRQVQLRHAGPGPRTTIYRHLDSFAISEGARVTRGAVIGTMGMTGALAGGVPHLHFEVHLAGNTDPVDPNLHWADGVGRIRCFDPSRTPTGGFVYPVRC